MSEEKKVVLDLAGAKSVGRLHEMLQEAFGFPDYYGKNWDALYDCLGDLLTDGERCEVEIRGFYSMDEALRRQCAPMLTVFGDAQEEWSNLKVTVFS